jgi:hypothetical protein
MEAAQNQSRLAMMRISSSVPGVNQFTDTNRRPYGIKLVDELILDYHEICKVCSQINVVSPHVHDMLKAKTSRSEMHGHKPKRISRNSGNNFGGKVRVVIKACGYRRRGRLKHQKAETGRSDSTNSASPVSFSTS